MDTLALVAHSKHTFSKYMKTQDTKLKICQARGIFVKTGYSVARDRANVTR